MGRFIHTDVNGLWMRFSTYECNDKSLPKITLIPTVHLGNSSFYREVKEESFCNDIVLFESAYAPFKRLFRSLFSVMAIRTKLTLEAQPKKGKSKSGVFQQEEPLGPRVREFEYKYEGLPKRKIRQVIADADKSQFLQSMRKIPLGAKVAFPFILIFLIIAAPFIASRDLFISFGHKEECDCKQCKDSLYQGSPTKHQEHKWDLFGWCLDQYDTYMIGDRDKILKNILIHEVNKHQHLSKSIAVQYGAAHMDVLEKAIKNLGYSLSYNRLVFAFSKSKDHQLLDEEAGYNLARAKFKKLPSNITPDSVLLNRDNFYSNTQTAIDYKPVA